MVRDEVEKYELQQHQISDCRLIYYPGLRLDLTVGIIDSECTKQTAVGGASEE